MRTMALAILIGLIAIAIVSAPHTARAARACSAGACLVVKKPSKRCPGKKGKAPKKGKPAKRLCPRPAKPQPPAPSPAAAAATSGSRVEGEGAGRKDNSGLLAPGAVMLVADTVSETGRRHLVLAYGSPYGRRMILNAYAPAESARPLVWVWRFAPPFWGGILDHCAPYGGDRVVDWQFVFVCAAVDNRTGPAGERGYDDPAGIHAAIALQGEVEARLAIAPARHATTGMSATGAYALFAAGLRPDLFSAAISFDGPVDLAVRYAYLGEAGQASMAHDFGGPPVGELADAYRARSPIGVLDRLVAARTELYLYAGQGDSATCPVGQLPAFVKRYSALSGGRSLRVGTGDWPHGGTYATYARLTAEQLGIVQPEPTTEAPRFVQVDADNVGRLLGC